MLVTYLYAGPSELEENRIASAKKIALALVQRANECEALGGMIDEETMTEYDIQDTEYDQAEFLLYAKKADELLNDFLSAWDGEEAYANIRDIEVNGSWLRLFCAGDASTGGDPDVEIFRTCEWLEKFGLIDELGIL